MNILKSRTMAVILVLGFIAVVLFCLSSCAYQPPGAGLIKAFAA